MGVIKRKINNIIIRRQGGQATSTLLREIAKTKKVCIGMYSYGSCFSDEFNTGGEVEIGRYCSFGPNVRYFGGNHPLEYVSMSPYFYQQTWSMKFSNIKVKDIERSKLIVGHGCWIGANAIILSGCHKIGNGAVVGAGAVVTKDVPPYSVVVGNPARVIKFRFDEESIKMIEESKWYELSPDKLLEQYDSIDDAKTFCKIIIDYKKK